MKILIVTHSYPRWKGDWSANFIEALCQGYIRSGHEVVLFLPNNPQWARTETDLQSVRVVLFNYFPIRKWQVFGYGKAMHDDLKPSGFQIFLLPWLLISGTIQLARLLRKERSVGFIHSHWAFPNSIIAVIARAISRKKNIPVFSSFPGSDVTALALMGRFGRFMVKKIIGKSDNFSSNSNDLRDSLINLGLPPQKIDLVIYGVDAEAIKFDEEARNRIRAEHLIGNNEKLLLMAGRFVPKKGFNTAFRALKTITKEYPNCKMIVIGDGKLKQEYVNILENDKQTSFVIFTGNVPLRQLHEYYSACDIFVMPSRKLPADGLNVTVVEAMACARPVVASNVGGNELVIFNGMNGFLHEEDNSSQLADKVLELLKDEILAEKLGKTSRALVDEKFNWPSIAQHYVEQYYIIGNNNMTTMQQTNGK